MSKQIEEELENKLSEILAKPTFEHPGVGEYTLWDITGNDKGEEWGYVLFKEILQLIAQHDAAKRAELEAELSHITDYQVDTLTRGSIDSNGRRVDEYYGRLTDIEDNLKKVVAKVYGGEK